MRDFTDDLRDLRRRVTEAHTYLRIDDARTRLTELEADASRPDLWDDPDKARLVTTEMARVREDVELVDGLDTRVSDLETLFDLGREEDDDSVEGEIESGAKRLATELDQLELRALFTGDHDERDAICETHAGAGGTDAQDWADMMLRMYTRWAQQEGFDVELDDRSEGTE